MRYAVVALVISVTLTGCLRPLHVCGRVDIATPCRTENHIISETPPVLTGGPIQERSLGGCRCPTAPKIAVVDVDGLLLNMDMTGPYSMGENPLALFREKLDAAAADADVRAVVVRINSPGGGVTPSDIMWRELLAFRECTHKPVVACLMDVGAGGAYYLACAADHIVAHPTSVTGGIGVILNLYNLRDAMAYFNVFSQAIKSGTHIDMGTSITALPPEVRQLLQQMANDFHERFKQVVLKARPGVDAADETIFDGRVFTAEVALQKKLIDQVGYMDDAIAAATQLAGMDQAQVILLRRCNDPAHSYYAVTPNVPLQSGSMIPVSVPGLDRTRLPSFLYMWQPEATLERLSGR